MDQATRRTIRRLMAQLTVNLRIPSVLVIF